MAERYVLLVEDDPDAAVLMQRVLEKADPDCAVRILNDGAQAIGFLSERIKGPSIALPLVIITDLKMPRMTGFDVISWVRSEPGLAELPVVVVSASGVQADMDRAMSLGANAYFEKPLGLPELFAIAQSILAGKTDR